MGTCALLLSAGVVLGQEQHRTSSPNPSDAQDNGHCNGSGHRTFTVPFHSINGLILLDATVNGRPSVLILDTGSRDSMVDSRSIGFTPLPGRLHPTGAVGTAGICNVFEVDIKLDRASWPNRKVCVLDLSEASRHLGVHIDGLVGEDVLREFSAVRIDFKNRVVEMEEQ